MAEPRPDVSRLHFLITTPLVLMVVYSALAAVIGLIRHGNAHNAVIAALFATVPSWKLSVIFVPRRATWRTNIITCVVLSVIIFAVVIATDVVVKMDE